MKVALCLSGQPRYYDGYVYQNIKEHLLDKYNPDVFFHTWWDESEIGKKQYRSPWFDHVFPQDYVITSNVEQNLIKMYNPKKYEVEKSKFFSSDHLIDVQMDRTYYEKSLLPFLYSQYKVANMKSRYEKEQGFEYDLVIMTRFDICIGVLDNLENFDVNNFNITNVVQRDGYCSDHFCFTSSSNFDKIYLTLFGSIASYINNDRILDAMEALLWHHVHDIYKIPIHKSRRMYIHILRSMSEPDWIKTKEWLYKPEFYDFN